MATVFAAVAAAAASGGVGAGISSAVGGAVSAGAAGSALGGVATISNVLSAGSALAAIGQGFAARSQAKTQAAFARAQSEQELARGAAERRDLAREYAELSADQRVAQLANGLAPDIGTPANVARATAQTANRNLDVSRRNAANRSAMQRVRSRGLLAEGRAALLGGFTQAAGIGLDAYRLTG